MTNKIDRRADLENPDNWDWEHQTLRQPAKLKRSVVSVPFCHADFQKVATAAHSLHVPISVFVRLGALEKTERDAPMLPLGWSAGNRARTHVSGGSNAETESAFRLDLRIDQADGITLAGATT
ncbi:MAG: hypothetical protein HY675_08075 [Chloroflexi bacterium]|nr:hypothetical protein [Chloroflexota bacterium]